MSTSDFRRHLLRQSPIRIILCAVVGFAALSAGLQAAESGTPVAATPASEPAIQLVDYVITATRTERPIDETPGTVTAANLLDDATIATLRDMTRNEPLVSVPFVAYGSGVAYQRGGFRSVNIRGVEGNRVLLQVDGIRLPDEFTLGGSEPLGRDYLEPDSLKRVEIVHGSASALHGSDALGGVVSFMTKSPEDYLEGAGRPYHLGYRATWHSVNDGVAHSVTTAGRSGQVSGLLVYTRRDGHETDNNGSVAPNPETFSSDSVLAKLVWTPGRDNRLEFTADWLNRDHLSDNVNQETSTGASTRADLRTESETQRFRLSLDYSYRPAHGSALVDVLDARLYTQDSVLRDRTRELYNYNPPTAANGSFRDRQIETAYHNDTVGFSANGIKRVGDAHRFAFGIEGSTTDTSKPWWSRVENAHGVTFPVEPRMADTETRRLGAYLQDEFEWTFASRRKLTLIPGIRVDQFELKPDNSPSYLATTAGVPAPGFDATAVSPKLAVLVSLADRVNAYAQYNRGFRYPTAEDLTATFTNPVARYRTLPNPDLRDETSDAFEVGVKGFVTSHAHVRVSAFTTSYDEFIEQIALAPTEFQDFVNWPSGTFMTQNRADARIHGGEVAGSLDLRAFSESLAGFGVTASAGKAGGTYRADDGERISLASVEPFKANVGVNYHARDGAWSLGLRAAHAAAKQPGDGQFRVPSSTTLDLAGAWRLGEFVSVRFALNNLTDSKYWRYASVRGVSATNINEQERRTEPGINGVLSVALRY